VAAPAASGVSGPIQAVNVGEADFAEKTYQLLVDGDATRERTSVLVGVVRQQLRRTAARFERGGSSPGLRALLGAFLLVRAGEQRPELLDHGDKALAAGAAEVARLGQEGYAIALYAMLASELPEGPARNEVNGHLKAIAEFSRSTQGAGPLQSAATAARVAVQRALLESTPEALNVAKEQLVFWMRRAVEFNAKEQPIRSNADRDEPLEAFRGLRNGPISLTALYLRHGDAHGALTALDSAELSRLVSPELRDHLERAADERDPDAWASLYGYFENAAEGNDLGLDTELMAGAAWGAALELFRSEPATLHGSMPLAAQLVTHGMAEVGSLVLTNAITRASSREELSAGLGMVLNAIVAEDASGQLEAARQTYRASSRLLELADSRAATLKLSPSPARIRYVMAAIETRHAELDRALPLLEKAVAAEASVDALSMLASIQRQKKNFDAALAALDGVLDMARRASDALAESDALYQKFETLRDAGRTDAASKVLGEALTRSVEAQRMGRPGPSQARVERLLARVIEQYGEAAAMRRASQRAYEAANGDARQLAATVLDSARRALTRGDLPAARAAAQRALDASLGSDEIVYVALWLQLLEKKFNAPSDGTVEEAYSSIDDSSGWPTRLRAWARRKISDADLLAAARDPSERTEAAFYVAMTEIFAGKAEAAARLRDVAQSPAIDLMEVAIARDLVAGPKSYTLPSGVALP
jgi:tetratricopeptide (TPR) repeat protein